MMQLNSPSFTFEESIDECAYGITGNAALKAKLLHDKTTLKSVEDQYLRAARSGTLFTIPPINTEKHSDPTVIGSLKKSEMVKLYEQYFRGEKKPARKIYDALLNAAEGKCPFCGGIGNPRNLDHFLPKAHFPSFSILPYNLVPACRDCNMDGKADDYAKNAKDQIIQPYADEDKFFSEQWVYATYHTNGNEEPGVFEYYVLPPESWSNDDKQRVMKHFEDFNLAKRYATKAAELLGTVLKQIDGMWKAGLDNETIKTILLQPGIDAPSFVNHWQRSMYQALMETI